MRKWVVGVVLLLGPAAGARAEVTLPAQHHGDMTAQLKIAVLEKVHTQGLAEVRYTVTVQGGPHLDVEGAKLEEATAAWQVESVRFCWLEGDRLTATEQLELRQVKQGAAPLPGVSVRFRDNAGAAWEKHEWLDPLKPRVPLVPEQVPELARTLPWWLLLAFGGGVVVLVLSGVGLWVLSRPGKPAPPTPEQWALEEMVRLEGQFKGQRSEWYHTRLSYIVRRFLEEKHGLRAPRQTTAEFLQSVRLAPQVSDEQRELLRRLLERCDLAKFAPVQVSADDCRQATDLARTLVQGEGRTDLRPSPPYSGERGRG
jgi:hypothetical protein